MLDEGFTREELLSPYCPFRRPRPAANPSAAVRRITETTGAAPRPDHRCYIVAEAAMRQPLPLGAAAGPERKRRRPNSVPVRWLVVRKAEAERPPHGHGGPLIVSYLDDRSHVKSKVRNGVGDRREREGLSS